MNSSFLWPKIIGHRGSAGTAPENTLISFREAYDNGVRAVEFDVVLAKDGVPVVFHDATLDRTTNGSGPVWERTSEELKELDAGSWFLPQFAGEPIPTLEEVLKLCSALGLLINMEIKAAPGMERETAEAAIRVAEALWPSDHPAPLISSFNLHSLEAALEMKPDWPRGLLLDEYPLNWKEVVRHIDATTINANGARSPAKLLELVATAKPVFVYTVNEVKRAQSLFALGIAGIFTDYPAQMSSRSIWVPPAL